MKPVPLPLWPPSSVPSVSMPRKSVKTSSRKVASGKVSELWLNSSAKTEQLRSVSSLPLQPWSSRSWATTKETERKPKTSLTRATSLSIKWRKSPRPSRRNPWPRTLPAQWNQFWALVCQSAAPLTSWTLNRWSQRSTTESSRSDYLKKYMLINTNSIKLAQQYSQTLPTPNKPQPSRTPTTTPQLHPSSPNFLPTP